MHKVRENKFQKFIGKVKSAIGKKRVSNKCVRLSVLGKQPTLGKGVPFPNDGFTLE